MIVFNAELFSRDVRCKRAADHKTMREYAARIGISASTLCRVENGKLPDTPAFMTICLCLELDPLCYFTQVCYFVQGGKEER